MPLEIFSNEKFVFLCFSFLCFCFYSLLLLFVCMKASNSISRNPFCFSIKNTKLSRCASCVARCIPPCELCAYFRNPQGQTISSWILVYLCVCPTISTALKVFGPKNIILCYWYISNTNLEKICHFPELRIYQK